MMPLGRYFLYVGGLLLGILFLIDWYMPQPGTQAVEAAPLNRSAIRVHSAHRWPSAVVFDTTQPTIVPPQPPIVAGNPAPVAKKPHDALALARVGEVPAAVVAHAPLPKQVKRRVRTARPIYSSRVASYETFGFRPFLGPSW